MTASAVDESMRYQVCNGMSQRVLTPKASRLAPLEGSVQMTVVFLRQLSREKKQQQARRRLQISKGRTINYPMLYSGVWVLFGILGAHQQSPHKQF